MFVLSLLFANGNSSVSVSKSAKDRSSNVLFIAKLVLLLAVDAVIAAGSFIISLLVSLVGMFSNLIIGFVIVLSSCDDVVVEFWSETVGDEGDGQPLITLLINALEDNGEEDDNVEYVFDVVDDSTKFG